jgi:hypothetical protein
MDNNDPKPNSLETFIKASQELHTIRINDEQIKINALYGINRLEQFLSIVETSIDYKTATAKLAFLMYTETEDNIKKIINLTEQDFLNAPDNELAAFAKIICEQADDSKINVTSDKEADIFRELFMASNAIHIKMTKNVEKFISPFITKKSRFDKTLDALEEVNRNVLSRINYTQINKVLDSADITFLQNASLFERHNEILYNANIAFEQSGIHRHHLQYDEALSYFRNNSDVFVECSNMLSQNIDRLTKSIMTPDILDEIHLINERVRQIANPFDELLSVMSDSFFTPIYNFWNSIDSDGVNRTFLEEKRKRIEHVLFDTKWFMYKADIAVGGFLIDVIDILTNRRITNKEKHIDKLVFAYVTPETFDNIWRDWKMRSLPTYTKRVLHEAILGYRQKKYATTTIILTSLWEGIVSELANQDGYRTSNKTKEQFADIVTKENGSLIISQFYNEYIMYNCYSISDVKDDVPGRHGFLHGWLKRYPSRKTALNAILFTDFLLDFYPYIEDD